MHEAIAQGTYLLFHHLDILEYPVAALLCLLVLDVSLSGRENKQINCTKYCALDQVLFCKSPINLLQLFIQLET